MSANRAIANFENENDDEIVTTSNSAVAGLRPNVAYPFAAAYKGNDNEPLVWTAIIAKSAGD